MTTLQVSEAIAFFSSLMEGYKKSHPRDSTETELAQEIFDNLITIENTGFSIYDIRESSNHFALLNEIGKSSDGLQHILSAVAACLPGIVQKDGRHIPTNAKPEDQKDWVPAFLKPFTDRTAWVNAFNAGAQLAEQSRYPYSNARYISVGQAAKRLEDEGFNVTVEDARVELSQKIAEAVGTTICAEISAMGSLNFLGNLFHWARQAYPFDFSQYLIGRNYAPGLGNRLPSIPVGYLYNLAFKSLLFPKTEPQDLKRHWKKAISLARDLVACLNVEQYSNFTFTGTDVARLESSLREAAQCDHCFSLRQWRLDFTPTMLLSFFPKEINVALLDRFGWDIDDAVALCKSIIHFSNTDPNIVLKDALVAGGAPKHKLTKLLDQFAHHEQDLNSDYLAPTDSIKADLLFRPLIRVGGQHVIIPAASLVGPAFYEAAIASVREVISKKEVDDLQGKGTERIIKHLFQTYGLPIIIENKTYNLGKDDAGECDFVLGDKDVIIFVECKAKALTRGSMAGVQGDALLDFAAGMFAAQTQALRHERILRSRGTLAFEDGSILNWDSRRIIKLSVTLLDHGALQDRMMLTHLEGALRGARFSSSATYSKKKQVAKLNEILELFRAETSKLESLSDDIIRVFHSAASLSVGQLEVLLAEGGDLNALAKRIARPITFGTFNTLLEYHYLKKQGLS